jgi:hypothetical protein
MKEATGAKRENSKDSFIVTYSVWWFKIMGSVNKHQAF